MFPYLPKATSNSDMNADFTQFSPSVQQSMSPTTAQLLAHPSTIMKRTLPQHLFPLLPLALVGRLCCTLPLMLQPCPAVHEACWGNCGSWKRPSVLGAREQSLGLATITRDTDPQKGWEKGMCCNHLQKRPKEQSVKPTGWWTSISSLGKITKQVLLVCSPSSGLQTEPWEPKGQGKGEENIRKRGKILRNFVFLSF